MTRQPTCPQNCTFSITGERGIMFLSRVVMDVTEKSASICACLLTLFMLWWSLYMIAVAGKKSNIEVVEGRI